MHPRSLYSKVSAVMLAVALLLQPLCTQPVLDLFFDFFNEAPPDITVTTANDSGPGSLRQAVADAQVGDRIGFGITGTITLSSRIVVNKPLEIAGPSAATLTVSGNGVTGIFSITQDSAVTISGLTLMNGRAENGGAIFNSGDLLVAGSTIRQNTAVSDGGGIYTFGDFNTRSKLTLRNSIVLSNTAVSGNGGGIFNCCSAFDLGYTTLTIQHSSVVGNAAKGGGGGIFFGNSTQLTIADSTIAQNKTLNPLADNGGATKTMALQSGSPAIDKIPANNCIDSKGDPLTTDQRSTSRPQGGLCDIGAFEYP